MSFFKKILNTIPRPILIKASLWVQPFVDLALRGKRFTDPINGKSYRKFLPYGYEQIRENVLSPGTLSLERHRLLWLFLKNQTDLFSKKIKVLHFAPEQAFYKKFRKNKHWDYTTTDLNSPIADVKADICNLPFEDNSFDLIICNHVLEHIPDDQKAMKELFRILKKGGHAILQVPYERERQTTFEDDSITDPQERRRIFGQYDHVRVYGMDYFEKLKNIGFKVEAVDYTEKLSEEIIEKYRLSTGELIPFCTK